MWGCNVISLYIYIFIYLYGNTSGNTIDAPAQGLQDIIQYINLREHMLKVTKQPWLIVHFFFKTQNAFVLNGLKQSYLHNLLFKFELLH